MMIMTTIPDLRGKNRGFTLIELVVAIAIVGIFAAIAIPSYQDSIRKSRRKAAAACLVEQPVMERYYTTNLRYTGAALPAGGCRTDLAAFYGFALNGVPNATTYAISAIPTGTTGCFMRDFGHQSGRSKIGNRHWYSGRLLESVNTETQKNPPKGGFFNSGARSWTRTNDPLINSQVL